MWKGSEQIFHHTQVILIFIYVQTHRSKKKIANAGTL